MQMHSKKNTLQPALKALTLFLMLWAFILLVYSPILSFNLFFEEEPIIYLANQKIISWYSLLQVYLHPTVLETYSVPFFRPSGHFLLYQLITPILGWHNNQAFLAVNYFFLALSCYLIIKIYALMFHRYSMGGYIACGIYLMHPALLLVRSAVMHSEFAFIFFTLWGFYCFALFCQANISALANPAVSRFVRLGLFGSSLILMAVAVTFKELALMLGPVLAMYLLIAPYQGGAISTCFGLLWRQGESRRVFIILTVMTLLLTTYVTMSWPTLQHPLLGVTSTGNTPFVIGLFFKTLFGFWTNKPLPVIVEWALRLQLGILMLGFYITYFTQSQDSGACVFTDKKAFLFLACAMFAFIVIPVFWGRAAAWHLSLTLVFLSLLLGFCFERICQFFIPDLSWQNGIKICYLLVLSVLVYVVANVTVSDLDSFSAVVNRNAVLHPPAIKNQLNAQSVLVVENSLISDSYLLGDSLYPLEPFVNDFGIRRLLPGKPFYKYPPTYSGTLFRYAFLLPELKEEIYAFQIDNLHRIPNITIYHWLQHFNNIFCVGYDAQGVWHDKTLAFKVNLMREQVFRHMRINPYQAVDAHEFNSGSKATVHLPFAEATFYCQYRCDGNPACKGFTYMLNKGGMATCYFEDLTVKQELQACSHCEIFTKKQLG